MEKSEFIGKVFSVPVKFDIDSSKQNFSQATQMVKVHIAYAGDNRNYSSIPKETFEAMIPTLYGVPVVGDFDETTGNFKGHGEEVVITDEGVEYRKNTHAYGYIDSQSEVRWVTGVEKDNPDREYLTVDAYLWTDYFSQARQVLNGNNNQSMEIEILDGDFREDGFFEVSDARFLSLCILGEDVEPCFEGASIKKYELGKQFNKITQEQINGGATKMKELEELKEKYTVLQAEKQELEETISDLTAKVEEVEKQIDNLDAENNTLKETISTKEEEFAAKEEEFAAKEEELNKLQEYKKNVELENKTAEVEEVLEAFNAKLLVEKEVISEEDFSALKEKAIAEYSKTELEKELSYMFVKNNISIAKEKQVFNINTKRTKKKEDSPYGDLIKYVE